MVIWGTKGGDGCEITDAVFCTSGAIYDGATNTWDQIAARGAPPPLGNYSLVSMGSSMILWGGLRSDAGPFLAFVNTGGRFDLRQ